MGLHFFLLFFILEAKHENCVKKIFLRSLHSEKFALFYLIFLKTFNFGVITIVIIIIIIIIITIIIPD